MELRPESVEVSALATSKEMRLIRSLILSATIVGLAAVNVSGQQPAPSPTPTPATQPPAAAAPATAPPVNAQSEGKVAIIDTEAFVDPKTGIVRLIRAFEAIEKEFKQIGDDLKKQRALFDQLGKEIEAMRNAAVVDQRTLVAKADQGETLKKDIERKTQDAQDRYKRRVREITEPIYNDIGPALQAYARQRGISVVFDVSKLSEVMFVINDSVDLTKAFIADYNKRNPAPAATAAPATAP